MNDEKKQFVTPNKIEAFATNAATEVYETETDAKLPVASDISVEVARDWVNEGSQL